MSRTIRLAHAASRRGAFMPALLVLTGLVYTAVLVLPRVGARVPERLHDALYVLLVALAVFTTARARRDAPASARPALAALTLALALYAAGEAAYTYLDVFTASPPFPSVADALYLAQYPPLVVALLRFSPLRRSRLDAARLVLDASAVALAAGVYAWTAGLSSVAGDTSQSVVARAIGLAYPLASLTVLGVLALVALRGERPARHELAIGAGLALIVLGDVAYALLEARGAYASGHPVDLSWAWAFVLLALGGHAAARVSRRSTPPPRANHLSARLAGWAPYAAVFTFALAALSPRLYANASLAERGAALGVLAGLLLVVLRQGVALAEHRRLTAAVTAAHARREHEARHDALTGLLNRAGLLDALGEHPDVPRVVLSIDLDRFGRVNDAHGAAAGDAVLRATAVRLGALARPAGLVARLGADEFALVAPAATRADADACAARVRAVLARPVPLAVGEAHVTASVGAAFAPDDAFTPDEVLLAAAMAARAAKRAGGDAWRPFDGEAKRRAERDARLEAALRDALAHGGLALHYQPMVHLASNRTIGVEALLRWPACPEADATPEEIVRVAEERGLGEPLGEWVLRRACRDARRWRGRGTGAFVSVNVAAPHFARADFADVVARALGDADLPGEALVLELTEGALLADVPDSVALLGALAERGVHVAIDDFGTGYSSLSYLRTLPVRFVKIDKSFVRTLHESGGAFVEAIARLAHARGLVVVAEGLEAGPPPPRVAALGVDVGQGFHFGRPAPLAAPVDPVRPS